MTFHCNRGPEDKSAETAAALAAAAATGDGKKKGGKKGKSIRVGCKAHFTVTVHTDSPSEATVSYDQLSHTGHEGEMAQFLSREADAFVRAQLLLHPDMPTAEVFQANLERYFAPVRAEHPEWDDDQIMDHLEEMDGLPRDFYLEEKDIDNIRTVRARARAPACVSRASTCPGSRGYTRMRLTNTL